MSDLDREVRRTHIALGAALGLAAAGIGFALLLRYGPAEWSAYGWSPLVGVAEPPENAAMGQVSVVTAGATPAESVAVVTDPAPAIEPAFDRALLSADVVLLPCTEPNPRPDGSFLIPPHNPTRHTIVGLPSGPGEPKRGLLIPPHNPNTDNRVPIQVVSLDSILAHTVRIPPHDPGGFKLARHDTLPCVN